MNLFDWLLVLHIVCGCICLLTGGAAMFARKKKGWHTWNGEIYHAFFAGILVTSTIMALLHWSESAHLFFIGFFSYSLALFGYLARKRRWNHWLPKHIAGMLGSYIALVTAVLVVNGHRIPLLQDLPVLALWFLPTLIGSPLIALVTRRYVSTQRK